MFIVLLLAVHVCFVACFVWTIFPCTHTYVLCACYQVTCARSIWLASSSYAWPFTVLVKRCTHRIIMTCVVIPAHVDMNQVLNFGWPSAYVSVSLVSGCNLLRLVFESGNSALLSYSSVFYFSSGTDRGGRDWRTCSRHSRCGFAKTVLEHALPGFRVCAWIEFLQRERGRKTWPSYLVDIALSGILTICKRYCPRVGLVHFHWRCSSSSKIPYLWSIPLYGIHKFDWHSGSVMIHASVELRIATRLKIDFRDEVLWSGVDITFTLEVAIVGACWTTDFEANRPVILFDVRLLWKKYSSNPNSKRKRSHSKRYEHVNRMIQITIQH